MMVELELNHGGDNVLQDAARKRTKTKTKKTVTMNRTPQ
jgi:hypothetical protein